MDNGLPDQNWSRLHFPPRSGVAIFRVYNALDIGKSQDIVKWKREWPFFYAW